MPYDLKVRTEGDSLMAFIDLCVARELYARFDTSVGDRARMLYNNLLEDFHAAFVAWFPDEEYDHRWDVNILGDSIVLFERKGGEEMLPFLLDLLLEYQLRIIANAAEDHGPVPSRAMISRGRFFSLDFTPGERGHFVKSEYTSVALCGGDGVVRMQEILRVLPTGTYVSDDLVGETRKHVGEDRLLPVRDMEIFFVKQKYDVRHLLRLLSPLGSDSRTIGEAIRASFARATHQEYEAGKWKSWIRAHEHRVEEIESVPEDRSDAKRVR